MSAFQPQEPREEVPAETLAQHLFTFFVIGNECTLFRHVRDRCEASPTFLPEVFGFQVFVYLVASIAIVLTNEYSRQPNSVKVIVSLKRLVHDEVVRRGIHSTDDVEGAIEEAASKLHGLLYTDPEAKPGYCFDWSQEWLKACGVEEYNPQVLFEFAHKWNTQNVVLAKMINEMRIVES